MSIHNKKSNPTSRKKIFWSSAALILLLIGILFSTFSKALPYLSEDNSYTADYAVSGEIYSFRKQAYLIEHYNDHGDEFDYTSAAEYLDGANRVISSPDALHKLEAEDGDDVYYLEATNEFVIVSADGYIRTYFRPDDGIDYYNRQ